jgi:hypothetical protein
VVTSTLSVSNEVWVATIVGVVLANAGQRERSLPCRTDILDVLSCSDRAGHRDRSKLGGLALSDDKISVIPDEGVESFGHPGQDLVVAPFLLVRGHGFDRDERGDFLSLGGLDGLDGLRSSVSSTREM